MDVDASQAVSPGGRRVGRWTVTGILGHGRLGTLYLAGDGSGTAACVRALDSRWLTGEAGRQQVLDLVRQLTAGTHPGVVPLLDLITLGDAWYLVSEVQAGPPLSALLAAAAHAGRLGAWAGDPATAAAVLADAGRACLDLHASGLAHGSLSSGDVLCGSDARARLSDPGLLRVLAGGPLEPAADARAFAGLAREARRAWIPPGHPFADVLDRAIRLAAPDTGEPDLAGAVDAIERAAGDLGPGRQDRVRLRRAVDAWVSTTPALGAPVSRATVIDPESGPVAPGVTALDLDPDPDPELPGSPAGLIRIGEPPRPVAGAAPRGGDAERRAETSPRWPEASRRRRRALTVAAAGVLAVLVIALALGLGRLTASEPLKIVDADVATASPEIGCGQQAVVSGVIRTNGAAGTLVYEWTRSDGVPTAGRQTEAVAARTTSVPVSFTLTVTGRGRLHEVISLSVLGPSPLGPHSAAVDYHC